MDWPGRGTERDTGIDLVARSVNGGFTATKCKFYASDHTLTKEDIDSFFTAWGRSPFTDCMIVATSDRWSANAERSLLRQQIPVTSERIDDLAAITVAWSAFDRTNSACLAAEQRLPLREHQRIAVEKVRAGFGATGTWGLSAVRLESCP